MKAFHGNAEIKAMYVARVKAHMLADEIEQGFYWENGKGCAVGCTIHGSDHSKYETELGIPRAIARLEDRIFEELPNEQAKAFPLAFLGAIEVGADLSQVLPRFFVWLLSDAQHGTARLCTEQGKEATIAVVDLYQRQLAGEAITSSDWRSDAADADADAAASASAAYAAADADAASVCAAYAAAASAAAAYAAADADAADAADASAYAAYAASSAYAAASAAARQEHFKLMRDKLLSLLSEAR